MMACLERGYRKPSHKITDLCCGWRLASEVHWGRSDDNLSPTPGASAMVQATNHLFGTRSRSSCRVVALVVYDNKPLITSDEPLSKSHRPRGSLLGGTVLTKHPTAVSPPARHHPFFWALVNSGRWSDSTAAKRNPARSPSPSRVGTESLPRYFAFWRNDGRIGSEYPTGLQNLSAKPFNQTDDHICCNDRMSLQVISRASGYSLHNSKRWRASIPWSFPLARRHFPAVRGKSEGAWADWKIRLHIFRGPSQASLMPRRNHSLCLLCTDGSIDLGRGSGHSIANDGEGSINIRTPERALQMESYPEVS